MSTFKISTVVTQDGVVHVSGLPCRAGDRVEGTLHAVHHTAAAERAAARAQLIELCRASRFRSTGPYPTRDQVHERD